MMKNVTWKSKFFFLLLCGAVAMTACESSDDEDGGGGSPGEGGSSITIGGNTDLGDNEIGNVVSGTVKLKVGSSNVVANGQGKVTNNSSGIVEADLSFSSDNEELMDIIKKLAEYGKEFDAGNSFSVSNGECKMKCKLLNSSEGVAYINSAGKQAVVMKYDVNVGDSWTYTMQNGKVERFKVTKKSTDNDYYYGAMKIKVVEVEQSSTAPGVSKVVYIGNHRFGLIDVKVKLEDGNDISFTR